MRSCDVEPIHVPGSIQPHGLLLLFDAGSETLAHWAGDVERLLGAQPAIGQRPIELLGAPLSELIGSCLMSNGEEAVLGGSIKPVGREPLTVTVSRTGSFIAIELEPVGEVGTAAAALEQVRAISDRFDAMPTLSDAFDSAAAFVRAITGYDRVMIYEFMPDWSGSVVAEARAPDMPAYLHHRFPASDIPAQARELYLLNLVRVIPDANYTPKLLRPECGGLPIDMTHCILRSVSPVHLQYLQNMGVGASMSISLLVDGKLWGLIACHHRSARCVPAEARLLCRHVGTSLSAFILTFSHNENSSRNAVCAAALETLLKSLRATDDPELTLRSSAKQMVKLVDCGGFALLANGELVAGAGQLPTDTGLRDLAPLLEERLVGRESYATESLGETLPCSPSVIALASGVLAVKLEASRPLLALWLRPEQVEEIIWAGDPREKDEVTEPSKALTPRRSFAKWRERVRGRSRPWSLHEINVVKLFQGRAEFTIQRHRLKIAVEELGVANAALSALATTDALTGLSNRRLFDDRLTTAWQRASRHHSSIAIVAIDVDHFKKYNDHFGHPAGDECLKQVARAISAEHRQVDVAARIGGEEFGLLLSDIDANGAAVLAERVRLAVEQLGLAHPSNDAGIVTISLGIATGSPAVWGDPARLLSAADKALYEAKADGRNRIGTASVPAQIVC